MLRNTTEEKYDTSHAKLSQMLGLQNSNQPEVKSAPKNVSPGYIVLYMFNGTWKRGGIGHIALWDGASFYSYGDGQKIKNVFGFEESNERALTEHVLWKYGPHKKIILPCNLYLTENYETVRSNVNLHWEEIAYSFFSHNCAHMVQDYLVQAKYTVPIPDCFQFPLYPSEVANNAKYIGKALVEKILNNITSQSTMTCYQARLYKDFLVLLNDKINMRNILSELQEKELRDAMEANLSDQKKFCRILAILAHHHYDHTSFAYETEERDKFYESMFVEALHVESHRPRFENEAQIYKTGKLREPIAVSRAVVGAVCVIIVGSVVSVPALLFYFYDFLSNMSKQPPSNIDLTEGSYHAIKPI